jgi:hypothetical protein
MFSYKYSVVVIYRHDTSKDQPIGAINVPLYEVTPNKKTKIRKILNAPEKIVKDVETEVNKVEMSFSFDPQSCTLKVCINQAVIQTAYSKRYPNPYVTGHLTTLALSVNVKHKTRIVSHAVMPMFNEVLEFRVETSQLPMSILTISLWDHRKIAKDTFLGQVTLRGRKFWGKVKGSDMCSEWYDLQEKQSSSNVPSPLYGRTI